MTHQTLKKISTPDRRIRIIRLGGLLLAGSLALVAASGCSSDYREGTTVYKPVYYYPYDYYYYPSLGVYFHISSGYYFYHDGVSWLRVRTLPPRFYLDPNDRVRIVIKSDKPYLSHDAHRLRYTPRPDYRHDVERNKVERHHNTQRYQTYQKNRSRQR